MAQEIKLPQSPKIIKKADQPTIIQIDGCYPGYGVTLANSLRRVLLSSLPGVAITGFKIKGVNHEFSTIPYVAEDVIKLGLSLKKVCFSSQENLFEKTAQATLKVKGEKEVKAGDIKTPAGIEVVNKDLRIATLTDKKAELEMEFFISGGHGYERAEEREKEKLPIGTIALDAIYSPVIRVSYKVEDMRIGERTDFNRIILEITTDGSIKPEDAFTRASDILAKHFDLLSKLKKAKTESTKKKDSEPKKDDSKKTKRSEKPKKLEDLGLQEKIINTLKDNGIKSVAGLTSRKQDSVEDIKGIGKKAVSDIKRKLKKHDLSLKE